MELHARKTTPPETQEPQVQLAPHLTLEIPPSFEPSSRRALTTPDVRRRWLASLEFVPLPFLFLLPPLSLPPLFHCLSPLPPSLPSLSLFLSHALPPFPFPSLYLPPLSFFPAFRDARACLRPIASVSRGTPVAPVPCLLPSDLLARSTCLRGAAKRTTPVRGLRTRVDNPGRRRTVRNMHARAAAA